MQAVPVPMASSRRRQLETRSAERVKRARVMQPSAMPGQLGRLSVRPATVRRYQLLWDIVRAKLAQLNLNEHLVLISASSLDTVLAQVIEDMFLDGEPAHQGTALMAAVGWMVPRYSRWGQDCLPLCSQTLAGFKRLAPPKTRLPLPMPLIELLALLMARSGRWRAALMTMLATYCYLRPGEATSLRMSQIIMPVPHHPWITIVLHPVELGNPSKTQQFNEDIVLDLPEHAWMEAPLGALKAQLHPHELLGNETGRSYNALFQQVVHALHLDALGDQVPYVLRHSGASHDAVHKLRDLVSVQRRGRWLSLTSLRRYAKGGRLADQLSRVPQAVQLQMKEAKAQLTHFVQPTCGTDWRGGRVSLL
eukprot:5452987-Amphidinium_carterae.1